MPRLDFLGRLLQSRRLLKTLERIAAAQEQQLHLLVRLVEHLYGPEPEPASPEDLATLSGVSYARDDEQAAILSFIDRTLKDTGREPTDDEILAWLHERVH